ncbi:MAG: hypothetical protein GF331_23700 [Chitinivibrionales bacterium]|nr:hypothetical protein [Chitinivibrionales bacterium]
MVKLNENFVIDKDGHKVGVFLDIKTYEKMLEELEELDDIRAYDEARASGDEAVPFDQAVKEIEKERRKCRTK